MGTVSVKLLTCQFFFLMYRFKIYQLYKILMKLLLKNILQNLGWRVGYCHVMRCGYALYGLIFNIFHSEGYGFLPIFLVQWV